MHRGSLGHALPAAKLFATGKAQLREGVADVEFHGIDTPTHPFGNATVGHAMPHLLGDSPFRGGEHVIVRRASGSIRTHQVGMVAAAAANYPTRRRALLNTGLAGAPLRT